MSATSRASAKWRRKMLEENAREFRAKEALRLRNYRAQAKEKRRRSFRKTRLEEDLHVVQDESESSDDVDTWLYSAVEGFSRTSHRERSSSTHPTPPSQSSSRSIKNPHDDDETLLTPRRPLTTVTFQDAHDILANGQKLLREWNRRWGSGASFSHRAANALLGIGLVEVPADRARGEILDIIRKGREALLQLDFWIETIRVIEGLKERVTRADAALEPRSCLTCQCS